MEEADEVHYTVESLTCKQADISKYELVMGEHCPSERSIKTAINVEQYKCPHANYEFRQDERVH